MEQYLEQVGPVDVVASIQPIRWPMKRQFDPFKAIDDAVHAFTDEWRPRIGRKTPPMKPKRRPSTSTKDGVPSSSSSRFQNLVVDFLFLSGLARPSILST